MNNYLALISKMDFKSAATRRQVVIDFLTQLQVPYSLHEYSTGTNLIVKLGTSEQYIAFTCHLDRVRGSGGANDNAAAIVTCLGVIKEHIDTACTQPLMVIFFDEEENGRLGSQAYIRTYGYQHLKAVVNMELVGIGTELLIWPLDKPNHISTHLENTWHNCFPNQKAAILYAATFPIFYSDADSFLDAGMQNVLTFTRLTTNDYQIASQYITNELSYDAFMKEVSRCDIMRTYHQPNDLADTIQAGAINENVMLLLNTMMY
jgi:hypothetical protein